MQRTIKLLLAFALLLAGTYAVPAQLQLLGSGSNQPGAGGGGGGCSNALDFSKACNSQYISVLGIM